MKLFKQSKSVMKSIKLIVGFILFLVSVSVTNAQITQKATYGKFAITNAEIHTVTNGVIENGTVLIEGEKITYVGTNPDITSKFEVIDAEGKEIYPGFMDSGSKVGLIEVGSLPLTNDSDE